MTQQNKKNVLIDTNAIIEAHRVKCWNNLTSFFIMETVDECIMESGTGDSTREDYINVDVEHLRKSMLIHKTTQLEKAGFSLKYENADLLDMGERCLMAYALAKKDAWILCSPDKACVQAMCTLNFKNRTISLQELIDETGLNSKKLKLKEQYTKKWLKNYRLELILNSC